MCFVNDLFYYAGIFTSSVYGDRNLAKFFKGKKRINGKVIAVKTHRPATDIFDRAILLHRGIQATLVAESNRIFSNHTGVPGGHIFEGKGG